VRHLVAAAKAAHERLMVDTCEITRTAAGSFDDSTGLRMEIAHTIYDGPCRIKGSSVEQRDAGERNLAVTAPMLHLPADCSADIRERDIVTVTDSVNDNLIGLSFSIVGADVDSTASARRYVIEGRI
jgi:hypothetical protein